MILFKFNGHWTGFIQSNLLLNNWAVSPSFYSHWLWVLNNLLGFICHLCDVLYYNNVPYLFWGVAYFIYIYFPIILLYRPFTQWISLYAEFNVAISFVNFFNILQVGSLKSSPRIQCIDLISEWNWGDYFVCKMLLAINKDYDDSSKDFRSVNVGNYPVPIYLSSAMQGVRLE